MGKKKEEPVSDMSSASEDETPNVQAEPKKVKLKVKKYNPATRKHEFFVEKKLPPHSK